MADKVDEFGESFNKLLIIAEEMTKELYGDSSDVVKWRRKLEESIKTFIDDLIKIHPEIAMRLAEKGIL